MGTATLSGADTISINNRVLTDLATGDCVKLTFPNDVANVKTGKNGNSLYGFNTTGFQCEVEIVLTRGSADDKYMNGLLQQMLNNFAAFPLVIGEFIKKLGDGQGNVLNDTYLMSGGVFQRQQDGKSNVEGDTDQSTVVYKLKFSNSPRALT